MGSPSVLRSVIGGGSSPPRCWEGESSLAKSFDSPSRFDIQTLSQGKGRSMEEGVSRWEGVDLLKKGSEQYNVLKFPGIHSSVAFSSAFIISSSVYSPL